MLCALIRNGVVVGIVDLSDEDFATGIASHYEQVIEITNLVPQPQIGWSFNGQTIIGSSVSRKITRLAMRQRFTFSELIALSNAAAAIPAVKVLMDNLSTATYIDLARSDTAGGVGLLVSLNLITAERANTILNTVANESEIFRGETQ